MRLEFNFSILLQHILHCYYYFDEYVLDYGYGDWEYYFKNDNSFDIEDNLIDSNSDSTVHNTVLFVIVII